MVFRFSDLDSFTGNSHDTYATYKSLEVVNNKIYEQMYIISFLIISVLRNLCPTRRDSDFEQCLFNVGQTECMLCPMKCPETLIFT